MSGDLDALIGDLRAEAARPRAAPDFPLDEEAVLAGELDAHGPVRSRGDLTAVLAELDRLASAQPGEGVAALAAAATRSLDVRLGRLERAAGRAGREPAGAGPGTAPDPVSWAAAVDRFVASAPRSEPAPPVLVAGPAAGAWLDAGAGSLGGYPLYAVDPTAAEFAERGPLRSGDVRPHLGSVADDGLAAVLLPGPYPAAEAPSLPAWAADLARVTSTVVVVGEAPWHWRARLGPVGADTAAWRPVAAETWMELLAGTGFRLAAAFGTGGRDYCVAARRGGGAPDGLDGLSRPG